MHRKFNLRRLLARYETLADDPATDPQATPPTPPAGDGHADDDKGTLGANGLKALEADDDKGTLGANGLKALEAERAANKASKKQIAELQAKLKEYEDVNKSEAEKTAERLATLEKDNAASRSRAERLEVALDKGLPKALAARLQGSTREELEADADELLKLVGEQKPASPKPDPSQGHGGAGAKPTSMEAAIAAALGAK